MIYINLLPVRDIKSRIAAKRQIYTSLFFLFILILTIGIFSWYQSSIISELTIENEKIANEKKKYTQILNQIKQLDEEKKILENRIAVIKNLRKDSSITVHVLDEIANLTPSKRMWLKTIDQSSSKLMISGMALDDQTIAKYMDDLDKSDYIKNIVLANTTMDKYAERNLKSFSISCTVGIEDNQQ